MSRLQRVDELPWSLTSEQQVLGALLISGESFAHVGDWLTDDDFYRRDHALIYRAVMEQAELSKPYDVVTIIDWFESNGLSGEVQNGAYLLELTHTQASAANIVAHAEIVKSKAKLRSSIEIATRLINACHRPKGREVEAIVAEATAALSVLHGDPRAGGLVPYQTLLRPWFDEFLERYESGVLPGLATPWEGVNEALNGLQDGELLILGAASNAGKSVLAFQLGRYLGRQHHGAIFSMEQTGKQIVGRDIAGVGGVPYQWLQRPMKDDEDSDLYCARITTAIGEQHKISCVVDTQARLSTMQIRARARRSHMQKRLRWVIVDHLHEIALPGKQNETIERGDAARDLKALGKELGCPMIVLAQLNRAGRDGKPPDMSSLRGSGGIEEAADVVLFLHRPDAFDKNDRPGLLEAIVGKGRDIKTGTVINLRSRYDEMRIEEWGDAPLPVPASSRAGVDDQWKHVRSGQRSGYKPPLTGSRGKRNNGDD